jgi:hypothetical protein
MPALMPLLLSLACLVSACASGSHGRNAPALGQHSDAVLRQLELTGEQIAQLRERASPVEAPGAQRAAIILTPSPMNTVPASRSSHWLALGRRFSQTPMLPEK